MGARNQQPSFPTSIRSSETPYRSRSLSYTRVRVQDLLNEDPTPSARHDLRVASSSVRVRSSNRAEFKCATPNCGRSFQSKTSLSAHKRQCKPGPTPFVCSRCSSSFSSNANLNKHVSKLHFVASHFTFLPIKKVSLTSQNWLVFFQCICGLTGANGSWQSETSQMLLLPRPIFISWRSG